MKDNMYEALDCPDEKAEIRPIWIASHNKLLKIAITSKKRRKIRDQLVEGL